MAVFSANPSPFPPQERAPQPVELQLLPDNELMDLWEQTQHAAWAMEGKGWDAEAALRYGGMVVWEMQRRLARRPSRQRFGSGEAPQAAPDLASDPLPHIVAIRM